MTDVGLKPRSPGADTALAGGGWLAGKHTTQGCLTPSNARLAALQQDAGADIIGSLHTSKPLNKGFWALNTWRSRFPAQTPMHLCLPGASLQP